MTRRILRHRGVVLLAGVILGAGALWLVGIRPAQLLSLSLVAGAIALSFQGYLSSAIAGVTLYAEGLVAVGDSITVNGLSGTVVRRRLRTTRVVDADGVTEFPNSVLLNSPITIHRLPQEKP